MYTCKVLCLFVLFVFTNGQQSQSELSKTPQAIKYMKQYGYLADFGPNTEALYSKKGITNAIKTMQKYGGLVPTGVLDKATLALFTKPRCGVRDVEPDTNLKKRTKRYVIASEGWHNDLLTYGIGSFPKSIERGVTRSKLRAAFDVWSNIKDVPLKFRETEVRFGSSRKPDMEILFEKDNHGDNYPFDGQGNILAHAFFPHRSSDRGGDVHFDAEENWADLSRDDATDIDAVDLFTVAAHEIGHALGLAHSSDTSALMFPYYKGYTEVDKIIGQDDILAMKELYINRRKNEVENAHTTTRRTRPTRTRPTRTAVRRTRRTRRPPTRDTRPSRRPITRHTRPPTRRPTNPTRRTTLQRPGSMELPNLCDGSFDAMSVIRGELMIFKERFLWRFQDKGRLNPRFPVEFRRFFYKFPEEIIKIDAIYEFSVDDKWKIIFFTGPEYWVFDGVNFIDESPQPLSNLGLPLHVQKVDAALHRAKEKMTYLFIGNAYFKYNETAKCLESRYPNKIRTTGIQPYVDNAFEWKDGHSYVFKGKHFWRLKDDDILVEEQIANRGPQLWAGCR